MSEIPQAIIDRDAELARLREQNARTAPTEGRPRETRGALEALNDTQQLALTTAIAWLCEREGMSPDEAAAELAKPVASAAVDRAREQHEAREAAIRTSFDALALPISPPALYADVIARNVPSVPATRIAGNWLRNINARRRGESVRLWTMTVVLGGIGLGKTVGGGLCASQFLRWGLTVAYVEESELVHLSRRRTLQHEEQLEALLDVDLLILDELGTSTAPAAEVREAFRSMFTARIRRPNAYTMMIGNLADDLPDDAPAEQREQHARERFATTYGARLVDRLVQMGTVEHVAGPSMRGKPYVGR